MCFWFTHLVAVVGVDELVIIDTVGCVALNSLDCGFAGVEGNDVVDQSLTGGRQLDALAWVGCVVFRRRSLTDFKLLAGCRRHLGCGCESTDGSLTVRSWIDAAADDCSCWGGESG